MFCNAVVFAEVMKDPEICRRLIERILPGKKVKELRFVKEEDEFENAHTVREILVKEPETEKTITVGLYAKSIRLDVLFEGENEWYNIEMQVAPQEDLPHRGRYYSAVIDVTHLDSCQRFIQLFCYRTHFCHAAWERDFSAVVYDLSYRGDNRSSAA